LNADNIEGLMSGRVADHLPGAGRSPNIVQLPERLRTPKARQ